MLDIYKLSKFVRRISASAPHPITKGVLADPIVAPEFYSSRSFGLKINTSFNDVHIFSAVVEISGLCIHLILEAMLSNS